MQRPKILVIASGEMARLPCSARAQGYTSLSRLTECMLAEGYEADEVNGRMPYKFIFDSPPGILKDTAIYTRLLDDEVQARIKEAVEGYDGIVLMEQGGYSYLLASFRKIKFEGPVILARTHARTTQSDSEAIMAGARAVISVGSQRWAPSKGIQDVAAYESVVSLMTALGREEHILHTRFSGKPSLSAECGRAYGLDFDYLHPDIPAAPAKLVITFPVGQALERKEPRGR